MNEKAMAMQRTMMKIIIINGTLKDNTINAFLKYDHQAAIPRSLLIHVCSCLIAQKVMESVIVVLDVTTDLP